MSPGYVMFLVLATAVMVGISGIYLMLRTELTGRMKHVASLKSQVLDLKTSNDAEQKSARKPWENWGWYIRGKTRFSILR